MPGAKPGADHSPGTLGRASLRAAFSGPFLVLYVLLVQYLKAVFDWCTHKGEAVSGILWTLPRYGIRHVSNVTSENGRTVDADWYETIFLGVTYIPQCLLSHGQKTDDFVKTENVDPLALRPSSAQSPIGTLWLLPASKD
ncbi:hypothetical protein EVAR_89089_1 [Eumeta japonica]|uniref:Uncharacterized protein n=1 Tax=Eumeta variegata TaxID=151549 RepID=A0A4C1XHE5_EUMVA|nr:hypothetical protein EVAR_89089_1 [Eumeta japonica]